MKNQRVRYEDALLMLEKDIKNYKDKLHANEIFDEDYAGGSKSFINGDLIKDFIKKLTR
jgi:hypothetical protein